MRDLDVGRLKNKFEFNKLEYNMFFLKRYKKYIYAYRQHIKIFGYEYRFYQILHGSDIGNSSYLGSVTASLRTKTIHIVFTFNHPVWDDKYYKIPIDNIYSIELTIFDKQNNIAGCVMEYNIRDKHCILEYLTKDYLKSSKDEYNKAIEVRNVKVCLCGKHDRKSMCLIQ